MCTSTFDGTKSRADIVGVAKSFSGLDSETTSKRCGVQRALAMALGLAKSLLAISAMVSVQAEKFGREETQPMGLRSGIPINSGSLGRDGKSTARQCVSLGRRNNL